MATQTAVELGELRSSPAGQLRVREEIRPSSSHGAQTSSSPSPDHSKTAYLVLTGCVLVQGPVWGFSLSFGIFQKYYTSNQIVPGSAGAIASIGTSHNGILYLMMPIASTLLTKYPHLRRWCGPVWLVLTTASLLASSYATSIEQLIVTQGVLYAVGCGLLFSPTSLYLDEWFIARKGLAYGIMWAGKSTVGVVMPFLMDAILSRYGLRTTLLVWTVTSAILTIPFLVLLKPRVPLAATTQSAQQPLSFTFIRHNLFWMLQIGNIIQSLGYLMPSTYMASYAQNLGLPDLTGPILMAVFSFASVPGGLFLGMLVDRLPATTVIMIASLGSTIAVFLLWGMSQQVAVVVLFAIMYGFFAGGFSSTWSGILHEMKRQDSGANTGLIFGMLMGGRGLGFVLSGPIGGALLETSKISASNFSGYATEYGPMMICTGFTAILGGWGWFWCQGSRVVSLIRA